MSGRWKNVNWLLGTLISAGVASLFIALLRGSNRSVIVPIVFIAVIIVCARTFGLLAGILGSLSSTVLFALYLFEPYGNLRVHNWQAMSNLGLMLFAGIALSYANSEKHEHRPPQPGLKTR